MEEDIQQKISWDVYKKEMEKICNSTRDVKTALLKKAKIARISSIVIGYPVKILLSSAASGGVVEILTAEQNAYNTPGSIGWIVILRTIFELLALVLVVTQDFFQFETQIEKYYAAAAAVDTFYKSVKYQSFHIKGTEGDRLDTLLDYQKLYEEIVNNNQIIQTVEDMHSVSTEDNPDIEMGERRASVDDAATRRTNNNRIMYLQTMLDRMPS